MSTALFHIETGSNTVVLDKQRTGRASFSVTNISGRQLDQVRLEIDIPEPATQSWFTVDGDQVREFGVGALHQVTVKLAVPLDALAGQYTFRLRAIDLENPDEWYGDSPAVTFAVPEVPEKTKGKPRLWIGLAAAALLILVFGAALIYFLLRDGEPEVPSAPEPVVTEVALPDLVVNEVSLFRSTCYYSRDQYVYTTNTNREYIVVANIGGARSGPFAIRVEFDRDVVEQKPASPVMSEVYVANLEAGETITVSIPTAITFSLPISTIFAEGTRYPGVAVVDSNNQVNEADERNNRRPGDLILKLCDEFIVATRDLELFDWMKFFLTPTRTPDF